MTRDEALKTAVALLSAVLNEPALANGEEWQEAVSALFKADITQDRKVDDPAWLACYLVALEAGLKRASDKLLSDPETFATEFAKKVADLSVA